MLRRTTGTLVVALMAASCTAPDASGPPSTTTTSPSPSRTATSPAPPQLDATMVADLRRVVRDHHDSELSVAIAPVGPGVEPRVVGQAPPLVAWSTIKVPLALAVVRSGHDAAQSITSALTASDNTAAQRLWETLGSGRDASAAVEAQLRRGGDEDTTVPSRVSVPGYSAFGQATWRLADQATFAAALPCLSGSEPVTDAMGEVVSSQRWGLGAIEGTLIKGGWGPTPEGYVVRQIGIIPAAKGETATAVQVRTGTHEQGTAIMDEVATVFDRHRQDLPTGSCSAARL